MASPEYYLETIYRPPYSSAPSLLESSSSGITTLLRYVTCRSNVSESAPNNHERGLLKSKAHWWLRCGTLCIAGAAVWNHVASFVAVSDHCPAWVRNGGIFDRRGKLATTSVQSLMGSQHDSGDHMREVSGQRRIGIQGWTHKWHQHTNQVENGLQSLLADNLFVRN